MLKTQAAILKKIVIAILFAGAVATSLARADDAQEMAKITEIATLADSNNAEALRQMEQMYTQSKTSGSKKVRLEILRVLSSLYYDAGKIESSDHVIAELSQLAKDTQDPDGLAMADIMFSQQLIDQGKPDQALSILLMRQKQLTDAVSIESRMRLNSALGQAYYVGGNFELSLKYFLDALRQTDQLTYRREQNRIYKLEALFRLYVVMKNPEKALEMIREALALSVSKAPKTQASLSLSEGVALLDLGRMDQALAAYQRSLKIARDNKIPGAEVNSLINICDFYLRQNDYKKAEQYARESLLKAEKIEAKSSIFLARLNLGFSLAGQGKINQGIAIIKDVIEYYVDSGQKTDAEGILGEVAAMYERSGMYKEALATVRQQQKLSEELFRSDRTKAMLMMQEQFHAEQKQKQIELLARENELKDAYIRNHNLRQTITLLTAVVVVMAGIFVFMLYRRVRRVNQQLREANSQLQFHAVRDPLTGLYNRRSFVDMMKTRIEQSNTDRRSSGENNPDCLILLDIDHFKQINDTFGHSIGDMVLMEVAHRLSRVVRDTDMVLRWGGEEFLIFSPKSHPAQIAALVERLLYAVGETLVHAGDQNIQVTMTAGFISLPFSGVDESVLGWEKVLQIADMALYLGKANGRNRGYGISELRIPIEKALPVLEHDLAAAISEKMVELVEVLGPENKVQTGGGQRVVP